MTGVLLRRGLALLVLATAALAAQGAGTTRITWLGHATFRIEAPDGTVLVVDPWLKNPKSPLRGEKDPVAALGRVDYVLVTHAHRDHLADATAIARATGARLVTNFDLGKNMVRLLGFPEAQAGIATMMNIGGELALGAVRVAMVPAVHSSGMGNPFAGDQGPAVVYGGDPAGFVVSVRGGPTIYHSGDTAYFRDMATIGELYGPDVALLSAGDHFTMGPAHAARAALAVGARIVVPMHWGTFPILAQDVGAMEEALRGSAATLMVLRPGDSLVFQGRALLR
ncbi:metal-dependent hydrolase [Inmirania thermothiophila]|uniref:UPF0173 metal-dependent hydrolase EDC57_0484 n=1 Tax=Inmirania thermothiophila TaxID=1750597 RepID=A0A3N1Y6Y9_9GAMM|nr:metal-dependent hydrolase [Inmirania thermothiophila]ROR34586.1 L-ascorbate metabolism protein UlaG (beta-lactamase superfamily) [Inmirania thermothiophila]